MGTRNKRSGPVSVEVLRADELEIRPGRAQAEVLDRLVQQKVAEALAAREGFIFEPWFRTREVAYEIRRLQTIPERRRHARHFERHGCICCRRQDLPYGGLGFCTNCYQRIFREYKQIDLEFAQERPAGGE